MTEEDSKTRNTVVATLAVEFARGAINSLDDLNRAEPQLLAAKCLSLAGTVVDEANKVGDAETATTHVSNHH